MNTVYIELTDFHGGGKVLINPDLVPAIQGSFIHLYGGSITVRETYDEIVDLIAKAKGFERPTGSHTPGQED